MTIKEQIIKDANQLGYTVETVKNCLYRLKPVEGKPFLVNGIESLQYFVLNAQRKAS